MKHAVFAGAIVVVLAGALEGQGRGPLRVRHDKPLRTAQLDLATGTVTRGPAVGHKAAGTVSDFPNMDLGGFLGVETGGGFCRWFDAGIKGTSGNASDLMNNFVFAYCSSALDANSGGVGGSTTIGFYEGYMVGGGTSTTAVAILTLTGIPANTAVDCGFTGQPVYGCYLLEVTFPSLIPFSDGPIGYSWSFLDVNDHCSSIIADTLPFLSCVQSCSGPGPDGLGMIDAMDQYCPPGNLLSTFSFGTTQYGSYFTSMSMDIREVSDCTASVAAYNSTSPANVDVLTAEPIVLGDTWTAEVTHAAGTAGASTLLVRGAKIAGNGAPAGERGRLLVTGQFLANFSGIPDAIAPLSPSQKNFGTPIPLQIGLACNAWFAQALTLGAGAQRLSNGLEGATGTE